MKTNVGPRNSTGPLCSFMQCSLKKKKKEGKTKPKKPTPKTNKQANKIKTKTQQEIFVYLNNGSISYLWVPLNLTFCLLLYRY